MNVSRINLFLTYIIPSILSTVVMGSYSLIDGIIVSQSTGELGLMAVNISYPWVLIFEALGIMTATGAGVLISFARGKNKRVLAGDLFGNLLILQLIICCVIAPVLGIILPSILSFMGAEGELLKQAIIYGRICVFGVPATMLAVGTTTVIRNDGRPKLAMYLDVSGLILNIILDYIFIFPLQMGVPGAAWAIVVAESVRGICGLYYFTTKKTHLKIRRKSFMADSALVKQILRVGIPSFGTAVTLTFFLSFHNFLALKYGEEAGLAACTAINEIEAAALLIITGLSQGVQPLVAFLHGAKRYMQKKAMMRLGYISGVISGVIITSIFLINAKYISFLFNLNEDSGAIAINGLRISSLSFLFWGVLQVAEACYQASNKIAYSAFLVYGDTFFILPLCLFSFSALFGLNGIWAALPISRLLLLSAVLYLGFKNEKTAIRKKQNA